MGRFPGLGSGIGLACGLMGWGLGVGLYLAWGGGEPSSFDET